MTGLISARHLPVVITVDTDILSTTNYLFSKRVCRDRFNLLNRFCNIRFDQSFSDKIPIPTDKSINDIIDETAVQYLNSHDHILAMWSGGVDSTCMVSAFINAGGNNENFSIVCSASSIKESPWFYQWLTKTGTDIIVSDDIKGVLSTTKADCIVNGCCADQLFGHMIHRKDQSLYNQDWIKAIDSIYQYIHLPLSNASLEQFRQLWGHYAKVFELHLTEFCEFAWLYNFGVRYSLIRDSIPLQFANIGVNLPFSAFYDNYDFQCWSVGNFEHLKEYNQMFDDRHYKVPLKQYTYKVCNLVQSLYAGKHVSKIDCNEDVIAVKDTNNITLYTGIDKFNYQYVGAVIGNKYRKNQVLI